MTSDALLRLAAFTGLPRREQALLLRHTEIVRLPAHASLLTSPRPAGEMLLVVEGRLTAPGGRTAGPGSLVGAHALLQQLPQPFPWRTATDATVALVSTQQTRVLMSGCAAFATTVAVSLATELSAASAC